MANRSDFQADLPRQFKRMLAMEEAAGHIKDQHQRGEIKRVWLNAHKHHRDYINRRGTMAVGQNTDESE